MYVPEGQKRAPDLFTDGCEPPCGCWELNSGPLEEQAMLLTTEPSLQPNVFVFKNYISKSQCRAAEKEPTAQAMVFLEMERQRAPVPIHRTMHGCYCFDKYIMNR